MSHSTPVLLAQAQTIDDIPAGYWKLFCMSLLALIVGVGCVLWVISFVRKPSPTRINDNPPIEVRKAAKRYNHDANELRFAGIEERLEKHDEELKTIQQDRARTLQHINSRFERVLIGLAAIGGKMGVKMPSEEEQE